MNQIDRSSQVARGGRAASLALVALTLLSGAGCTVSPRGVFPGLERIPRGSEPIPQQFFDAARGHAGEGSDGRFIFPAPGYLSAWDFALSTDGTEARFRSSSAVGPILTLPFFGAAEERIYGRDGAVRRNRARWTPFWASTHTDPDWPATEPRSQTYGAPLFFTGFQDYGITPELRVDGWQTLWSIGPSMYSFRSEDPAGTSGWIMHPLTALGFGGLLWADYCVTSGLTQNSGHGPLFGWLGWFQHMDRVETRRFFHTEGPRNRVFRSLLAGILFWSFEETDDAGVVQDATHGPLFGMFGPGVWDGERVFRFLWLPIWY